MNKKIVIFVYNFQHKKSLKGMQIIKSHGLENIHVVASPKVKLNFSQSKNRISIREEEFINPIDISNQYGWESVVAPHNSEDALNYYKEIKPDVGVILGARILSKNVISSFSEGIFNFHPGLLPENRGLDNLKWAIYKNLPQGVTTHLIDENIDVGKKVIKQLIEVFPDDSIFDINSKLFDLQMNHLNKIILTNFQVSNPSSLISEHKSQKSVSDDIDDAVLNQFETYKTNYKNLMRSYLDRENPNSHLH